MRILSALGILLCSSLAYIACGSDDAGDTNPVAVEAAVGMCDI